MSASVVSEAMVISPTNTATKIDQSAETATQSEVEFASCDCCGLIEECTQAYIHRIRERYQGKWICGLCAEAVKYEMRMRNKREDEALVLHMSFCSKFKSSSSSSPPPNPAVHLISAMRRILRRSLDSPRSMPDSPSRRGRGLSRSVSQIPTGSSIDLNSSIDLDESPSSTSTQDDECVENRKDLDDENTCLS